MNNETGEGIITQYIILPGIQFFYNDFHMSNGQNQNKLPHADVLELNHCREGRFECRFANGTYQYIGSGDLAINLLSNQTVSTSFSAVSLSRHLHHHRFTKADSVIRKIDEMTGGLDIDLFSIANGFCKNGTCAVIRNQKIKSTTFFSELYCTKPYMHASYLKVKVLNCSFILELRKYRIPR